jgi:fimbrial chaperone protein
MGERRTRTWPSACASALAVAVFAASVPAAHGASLQVSPTSVSLQASQNAGGLTLANTGDAPLRGQVRVFRWRQSDGEDRLEPTTDLVVSPPMLRLAPGQHQLVRVIRPGPAPVGEEAGYRLIVDELPDSTPPDDDRRSLRFVLQYVIPVFLLPADGPPPSPELHARRVQAGGRTSLELRNRGRQHAQIADLQYVGPDGRRHAIAPGLSGYVLPGQTHRWPLPAIALPPGSGTFQARINGEPVAQTLPMDEVAR